MLWDYLDLSDGPTGCDDNTAQETVASSEAKSTDISTIILFKRNANAFSLNAIVDIRRRRLRRHEMMFGNISETTRDSSFKIHHNVTQVSLYLSTGNDITIYL